MRYLPFFLLLFIVCEVSCSRHGKKNASSIFSNEASPESEMIAAVLQHPKLDHFPEALVMDQKAIPLVKAFYDSRQYEPAWTDKGRLNKNGKELLSLLDSSMDYGLDTAFYQTGAFRHLFISDSAALQDTVAAATDVALTYYGMHFAVDIAAGILDSGTFQYKFKPEQLKQDLPKLLEKAIADKKVKERILALQPPYNEYRDLQKGLARFLKGKTLTDDTIVIPDNKKDSIGCYNKVREILVSRHFLDSAQAMNDTLLIRALKKFQEQRGLDADGKAGRKTREALGESTLELYLQLAASLERWRWESGMDSTRAWVNIPAYHLYVVQADTVYKTFRLIVGKPETPSPELSSRISYFILNPYWTVPRDISVKEMLPHILQDPNYLADKHFRVFDVHKKEVDPSTIKWKKLNKNNFPYTFRRDPGDFNDLGLIKFMFTNAYGIYLHDTPARDLFVRDARGYSHGCIRMQHPFDFADYLLQRDSNKIQIDSVMTLVTEKVQKTITLRHKMPIYIRYITSEADKDGRLFFYQDIYGRDEKIREKMLKNYKGFFQSQAGKSAPLAKQ